MENHPRFPPFGVVFLPLRKVKFVIGKLRMMDQTLQLTGRERQIVRFIAQGMTTPQIAEALSLSPETVKWHRKKILAKFSAATSAEMVRMSIEQGIL